jgi:hypothetical protein
MKFKIYIILSIAILLTGNAIGIEDQTSSSPLAQIDRPIYEFDPVVDGVQVIHDYVIQNKGTGTLEIQKVRTG